MRLNILVLFLLFIGQANGALLNWDGLTWSPGSLAQSYDIDSNNNGNDISISIEGNTSKLITSYPQITQNLTGGLTPTDSSLQLTTDFSSKNQSIIITVLFNYDGGVNNVNFSLFNIDADGKSFVDQIRNIEATDINNNIITPTSIVGSKNNTVSDNTITGNALVGNTSDKGNATIDFGTTVISKLQLTFGTSQLSKNNPSQQSISFYDINFTPVPEMGVGLIYGIFCVFIVCLNLFWRGQPFRQVH